MRNEIKIKPDRYKCIKCGLIKEKQDYPYENGRYKNECKKCKAKRMIDWKHKTGRAIFYKGDIIFKEFNGSERKCSKCQLIKNINEFHKDHRGVKGQLSGYSSWCKECHNKWQKNRRIKSCRIYYLKCDFCKNDFISNRKNKRYCSEKCSRLIENNKANNKYKEDKIYRENRKNYSKISHLKDRSKMIDRKHKRESLVIKQNDGTILRGYIAKIMRETKKCIYCGLTMNKGNKSIDHMDPLSLGGVHGVSNVICCCLSCNLNKRNKTFTEWVNSLDELNKIRSVKLYEKIKKVNIRQISFMFKYGQ